MPILWRDQQPVPESHPGAYCLECRLPFRLEDLRPIRRNGFGYLCLWHYNRMNERWAAA